MSDYVARKGDFALMPVTSSYSMMHGPTIRESKFVLVQVLSCNVRGIVLTVRTFTNGPKVKAIAGCAIVPASKMHGAFSALIGTEYKTLAEAREALRPYVKGSN